MRLEKLKLLLLQRNGIGRHMYCTHIGRLAIMMIRLHWPAPQRNHSDWGSRLSQDITPAQGRKTEGGGADGG